MKASLLKKRLDEIGLPHPIAARINNVILDIRGRTEFTVTIWDVIQLREPDLLRRRNLGVKSVNALKAKLEEMGLELSD